MIPKFVNWQNITMMAAAFIAGIGGQTTFNLVNPPRLDPFTATQAAQLKAELKAEIKHEIDIYANTVIQEKLEEDMSNLENKLRQHIDENRRQ